MKRGERHIPYALTEEVCTTILDAVRIGSYPGVACRAAGIDPRTLERWRARAEEFIDEGVPAGKIPATERALVEFVLALHEAEAKAQITLLSKVWREKHWTAYMTILERRWPMQWGRSEKRYHEVTGAQGRPVQVEIPSDPDYLAAVVAALRDAGVVAPDEE